MEKKITNQKNKAYESNNGFSLIEILVALGMLGIITTGTMKIIQQQTKGQKTITIKSEMQNLVYRVRSMLRTNQGCIETLNTGNPNPVQKTIGIAKYQDETQALNECIANGANLGAISRGTTSIQIGQTFGRGTGAPIQLGEIKVIFKGPNDLTSPNVNNVDGVICYKIITDGIMEGSAYGNTESSGGANIPAQIFKWFLEPITVKNVFNSDATNPSDISLGSSDPERITNCNSDISSFAAAICTSIGGVFNDITQKCDSLILKSQAESQVASAMIARNSAISAQGNLAATGSAVFCGGVSIGADDQDIGSMVSNGTLPEQYCNNNRSANALNPGYLFVGDSVDIKNTMSATDGHFDSNVQIGDSANPAGYLLVNGTLEVIDSLVASGGSVSVKNLLVSEVAQVGKNLNVSGEAQIDGQASINQVIIKKDSIDTPGSLSFNQGGGNSGIYTFNGKVKGVNSKPISNAPEALDFLATVGYVDSLMLSTMTEENKRILFQALLDAADQTGIDQVALYAVRDKLGIESGSNSTTDNSGNHICQPGYSFKNLVKTCTADKCFLAADCQPIQQPSGTPTNCAWETTSGKGNIIHFTCSDQSKTIMSGSCTPPVNQDIKSSYHFAYKNVSGSISNSCYNNQCNTITCLNSSFVGTTASILCCDMTDSQSAGTPSKEEKTTLYFAVWDRNVLINAGFSSGDVDLIDLNPGLQELILLDPNIQTEILNDPALIQQDLNNLYNISTPLAPIYNPAPMQQLGP